VDVIGGAPQSPSADGVAPALDRRYRLTAAIVIGALVLAPLFWVRVPPLVDYPNHLARMWILVHDTATPQLAANYRVDWRILPDLGMDLVVSGLSLVMPVEQAGRVFVALTMLVLLGGSATLHRVLHRRYQLWPLCSALFIYNAALFWGFVSCLFAVGIYLFAFAGWIASREWRIDRRVLAFSPIASGLLLLHLFAFGLYALSVLAYEAGQRFERGPISRKDWIFFAGASAQLVPGLFLWYASLARGGYTTTIYGGLSAKIYALVAPFTFGGQLVLSDRLFAAAICLTLVAAIVSRAIRLAPEMRLPLAALVAAAVLMPNRMSGGWDADIRLPATLPFVIIASTQLAVTRRRVAGVGAATVLILLGLRVGSVSISWRDYDRWFGEFRSAAAVITPGARLLVVQSPLPDRARRLPGLPAALGIVQPAIFTHLAALAVIDRSAFFPYLFTGWTPVDVTAQSAAVSQREGVPATPGQLVAAADPTAPNYASEIAAATDFHGERPYWRDWPGRFDFVLWIDFGETRRAQLRQLAPLHRGSFFWLYRVVKPSARQSVRRHPAAPPG
jgi:hypothetical protein